MSGNRKPADRDPHPDTDCLRPDLHTILDTYRQPILGYLRRLTQSSSEAEDLAQEVFLRIHKNLASFRGEASVKTWIYRIATTVFLDYTRSAAKKREKASEPLDEFSGAPRLESTAPRPDRSISKSEMSACVQNYLHTLPPTYRTVLALHDVQGLTNREIAEALEITESTVKIRLHRARMRLKDKLNKGCRFSRDEEGTFVCDPKSGDR